MNKQLSIEKILWVKRGQGICATGRIPKEAEFFQDHFPGFPVLPGVLALEMLRQTAQAYLYHVGGEIKKQIISFKQIRATKFSIYLKPGDLWEAQLTLTGEEGEDSHWEGRLIHEGQTAVSSRFILKCVKAPELAQVF